MVELQFHQGRMKRWWTAVPCWSGNCPHAALLLILKGISMSRFNGILQNRTHEWDGLSGIPYGFFLRLSARLLLCLKPRGGRVCSEDIPF